MSTEQGRDEEGLMKDAAQKFYNSGEASFGS